MAYSKINGLIFPMKFTLLYIKTASNFWNVSFVLSLKNFLYNKWFISGGPFLKFEDKNELSFTSFFKLNSADDLSQDPEV